MNIINTKPLKVASYFLFIGTLLHFSYTLHIFAKEIENKQEKIAENRFNNPTSNDLPNSLPGECETTLIQERKPTKKGTTSEGSSTKGFLVQLFHVAGTLALIYQVSNWLWAYQKSSQLNVCQAERIVEENDLQLPSFCKKISAEYFLEKYFKRNMNQHTMFGKKENLNQMSKLMAKPLLFTTFQENPCEFYNLINDPIIDLQVIYKEHNILTFMITSDKFDYNIYQVLRKKGVKFKHVNSINLLLEVVKKKNFHALGDLLKSNLYDEIDIDLLETSIANKDYNTIRILQNSSNKKTAALEAVLDRKKFIAYHEKVANITLREGILDFIFDK